MIMTMKFWTVIVTVKLTSQHLVDINSGDLLPWCLLVTEKSAIEEESGEPESSDDKASDVWCKTD